MPSELAVSHVQLQKFLPPVRRLCFEGKAPHLTGLQHLLCLWSAQSAGDTVTQICVRSLKRLHMSSNMPCRATSASVSAEGCLLLCFATLQCRDCFERLGIRPAFRNQDRYTLACKVV